MWENPEEIQDGRCKMAARLKENVVVNYNTRYSLDLKNLNVSIPYLVQFKSAKGDGCFQVKKFTLIWSTFSLLTLNLKVRFKKCLNQLFSC